MEVSGFLQYVRDDPRVLDSLGLLRAYVVADEWARSEARPREFELRQLHSLVMPALRSAGSYKSRLNEIDGSQHTPTEPWRAAQEMSDLARWFENGCGDAVLDATVVHAWLTHIHPFEDGNGRMARLLANLALVQSRYPRLLLRSGPDRGQYLDALVASDEGDVVKAMEKPNYVNSKIRDELLATTEQRHQIWRGLAQTFFTCLEQKSRDTDWTIRLMGYPSLEDFDLFESRSVDGNCWFAKLRHYGVDEWLLWFGYRSDEMVDLVGQQRPWPSIFFAHRTDDPRSVHRFEPRFHADDDTRRPAEICLSSGTQRPVTLRWEYSTENLRIDEAAAVVIRATCR
jgi:Fic/DOC family